MSQKCGKTPLEPFHFSARVIKKTLIKIFFVLEMVSSERKISDENWNGKNESNMMTSAGKLSSELETGFDQRHTPVIMSARNHKSNWPLHLPPINQSQSKTPANGGESPLKPSTNQNVRSSFKADKQTEDNLGAPKRKSSNNSLDLVPVGIPINVSNTTLPAQNDTKPSESRKVYPDGAGGLKNKKYSINFCHLADAPLSFAK